MLCLFTSADKTQIRHTQQAGCCCLTAHVTAVKKVSRLGGPGCNAVEGPQSTFIREESIIWDLKLARFS